MRASVAVFVLLMLGSAAFIALRPVERAPAPTGVTLAELPRTEDAAANRALLASLIRSVVREELERALPHACAPATAPTAARERVVDAPREPTAEENDARDHALAVIDHARQSGRWGDEERRQFRPLFARLDGTNRAEVVQALGSALTHREFKVEPLGPLY
jgi:hypothetical protein